MTVFFAAGSFFCLVYWIVLTITAGFGGQHWIWLVFCAGFMVNAAAAFMYRRTPDRIPLWLITGLHTAVFAVMTVFIICGILIASRLNPPEAEGLDYIVVFGAEVKKDGTLSRSLESRLERAVEAAAENPKAFLVLTGGSNQPHMASEAEYMGQYLLGRGIPEERLLYEIQAKNTYENVLYSSALIERIEAGKKEKIRNAGIRPKGSEEILSVEEIPLRIGLLSSNYHLYRIEKLAEQTFRGGLFNIAVASPPSFFIHGAFRECIALLKDKYFGRF